MHVDISDLETITEDGMTIGRVKSIKRNDSMLMSCPETDCFYNVNNNCTSEKVHFVNSNCITKYTGPKNPKKHQESQDRDLRLRILDRATNIEISKPEANIIRARPAGSGYKDCHNWAELIKHIFEKIEVTRQDSIVVSYQGLCEYYYDRERKTGEPTNRIFLPSFVTGSKESILEVINYIAKDIVELILRAKIVVEEFNKGDE